MNINCKGCGVSFERRSFQKFCSVSCFNKYQTKRKPILCKICKKSFDPYGLRPMKFCSPKCFYAYEKIARLGKKNPAYRNGNRVGGKNDFDSQTTEKYRKDFLLKNNYQFCEECGVNQSMRWEVHHIVFRSEKPKHKYLHDFRNLIHICILCHNAFHGIGDRKKRYHLIKERGLIELFGKSIL